jgi:coxsackievirus/adenovirus receptor
VSHRNNEIIGIIICFLPYQTLNKDIYLRPEQITNLTSSINDTISSLKDIDTILADTSDDLELANSLKKQADKAK